MASNYQWRVIVEIKQSFNPVSMLMYATGDYTDAFEYLESRQHLITKKRKVFVKQVGSKHRHFHYDERFAAELLAQAEIDADVYYEEPTTDDRAIVQVHRRTYRPVVWKGIRRNS